MSEKEQKKEYDYREARSLEYIPLGTKVRVGLHTYTLVQKEEGSPKSDCAHCDAKHHMECIFLPPKACLASNGRVWRRYKEEKKELEGGKENEVE